MPESKSVEFAESALVDLEALRAWYVEQGVPEVGARFIVEIVGQAGQLVDFPESGRIVPEFGLAAVRELLHPPFRIVYRIGATKIWIVRVWRSERLLKMP
jgi:plasmid stabilization system protein ParE